MYRTNKSGFNGVSWENRRNKWYAYITIDSKNVHLGRFDDLDDAIQCRKNANIKFGYHPNHGGK